MKNIYLLLFIYSLSSIAQGQESQIIVDVPSIKKPWSDKELNNDLDQFQFAVVTDRTGGHRPGVFLKGINKLNLMQPEFVMSVGDLIEGYTEDTVRLKNEWDEFNGFIDSLKVPFFYVPGNHDITNRKMEEVWKNQFGVTYYHFVYKDVLFLCLNSEDNVRGAGRGTIDDEQYDYIKKALSENKNVKWTMVFLHQPLWVQKDTKRWADVEKLLEDRNHNVFAGHYHRYWKTERNNGKYIALATTGGGSALRGVSYGEFDHVVWITMTEDGPIIANLLLDGVWDEDVVTDELSQFIRNNPITLRIDPVKYSSDTFSLSQGEVILRNDSDFKSVTTIEAFPTNDLVFITESNTVELEPNSITKVKYTIRNLSGKGLNEITPIKINYQNKIIYKDRPDLVLKNNYNYKPVLSYDIEKTQPVKIDGNLKEWGKLNYKFSNMNLVGQPFDYTDENDGSGMFSIKYDEEYIYIAYEVIDDDLYISETESIAKQDAIYISLDYRSENISAFNSGRYTPDWMLFIQSLKKKDAIYKPENLPEGILYAIKEGKKGYTGEIAIPISEISKSQKDWKSLRFNIGIYDYDKDGAEKSELYWLPKWNHSSSVSGSGMFYKK